MFGVEQSSGTRAGHWRFPTSEQSPYETGCRGIPNRLVRGKIGERVSMAKLPTFEKQLRRDNGFWSGVWLDEWYIREPMVGFGTTEPVK